MSNSNRTSRTAKLSKALSWVRSQAMRCIFCPNEIMLKHYLEKTANRGNKNGFRRSKDGKKDKVNNDDNNNHNNSDDNNNHNNNDDNRSDKNFKKPFLDF